VLQQHLGVTKERFASPLNFNDDLPEYWSCHERDQLFGAHWNSYSCKWRGLSQANPEYEHEEMAKAVRWAVASAQATDAPVLTVLVLPAWTGNSNRTSYYRYIDEHPDKCHVLMRINKRHFAFCHPEAWTGARAYAGYPKWDVNILLVGNEAGLWHARAANHAALRADMINALRMVQQRTDAPPAERTDDYVKFMPVRTGDVRTTMNVTQRFRKLPNDDGACCVPAADVRGQWGDVRGLFAARRPLLVDAASLVYTDGSVMTLAAPSTEEHSSDLTDNAARLISGRVTVAGAGVYIPPRHQQEDAADTHHLRPTAIGQHIQLDPGNSEGAATITRAEGSAIWLALRDRLGTAIATDSATMLYQISNMLMRPHSMRHNRNKALVEEIVDLIRSSPAPVRLYKVKAHTGIPGNEHADWAARRAAQQLVKPAAVGAPKTDTNGPAQNSNMEWEPTQHDLPTCTVTMAPPWHSLYWPYVPHRRSQRPHKGVPDLKGHLKSVVHEQNCLGYSNIDSIYYQSWTQVLPKADNAVSNAFVRHCRDAADGHRRKLTLHYRTGGLYTAKLRHRMNKADTPNCALCGQLDGGHHSLSGCPKLKGLYTNRHNGAGKLILRYILKGSKGASVVMHDVGKHDDTEEDVAPRIPAWVYSTSAAASRHVPMQWHNYRPDALLVTGGPRKPVHKRHVHLVEIKYCRDTDWHRQQQRAELQHDDLVGHLIRVGYHQQRIHRHTILLGVGGTIYNDMYATLQRVGVNKRRGKLLAAKLHRHATAYVETIMHTKWHQESLCQPAKTGVG